MASAKTRTTLSKSDNRSRPAGLRSNGLPCILRQSWVRPFRRTGRDINASLRLIASARRVMDACDKSAVERPIRTTRQLERVSGWISEAAARLSRGVDRLIETNDRVALAPAHPGGAPVRVLYAARWLGAATQLATLSDQLDDRFAWLTGYIMGGAAPLDLHELFRKAGAPRTIAIRRGSAKALLIENSRIFCIRVRRERSTQLTVAEAPRRIFRGRAPPFLSTARSDHSS